MEVPPDAFFADAIDAALASANGQPVHIDAIARVLHGDVERDRYRNGYAVRALWRRGYLSVITVAVDQATDDFPQYILGWTEKGRRARAAAATTS